VRYRTRRHKLGSQGTGDAAGFTISPPAIALFLSHTYTHAHMLHHSFSSSHPRALRSFRPISSAKRILCKFMTAPDSASRIITSRSLEGIVATKWRPENYFVSRALAEISNLARAESLAGSTRFAVGERETEVAMKGQKHFVRSLRNYGRFEERVRREDASRDLKGPSLEEVVRALSHSRIYATLALMARARTRTYTHTHTHITRTHLHQEKMPRVCIHVRRKASADLYIRARKTREVVSSSAERFLPPAVRRSRECPRERFHAAPSNVAAPTTGKVSKLYSGLRISRISIPYYTTYYLTQTSSRSASPPSSAAPSAVLLLSLSTRHPTDFSTGRLASSPSHAQLTRANLSRARFGALENSRLSRIH